MLAGLSAAALCAAAARPDMAAEARPLAAELAKPRYAQSRCMLPALLADDGRSVIHATDAQLEPGDRMTAVDGEPLDEKGATALVGRLEHRPPDAIPAVTIVRGGAEHTFRVQCSDAKPYYSTLLAGAHAAVAGDASDCADEIAAAQRLHGLSTVWLRLLMSCRIDAGRLSGKAMWQTDYELYSQRIDEARGNEQELEFIRHAIVGAARDLSASGNVALAESLHRHYAAALGMKPPPSDPP
jgi:hypothetical protein